MYPRTLRPKERIAIESTLPLDRPGYRQIRERIGGFVVLAEGRRGTGHLVLGPELYVPDHTSPLNPVVAYGSIETTRDVFFIAVREPEVSQIDIEIMSKRGEEIPDHFEEKRRWTYSTWSPGDPSPCSGKRVREIAIDNAVVLAVAIDEKRVWVYDGTSGMVHLIPITNFYNELMLHTRIRDPKIALQSDRFFGDLLTYTDADLRGAFVAYNAMRRRVTIRPHERPDERRGRRALFGMFRKKKG